MTNLLLMDKKISFNVAFSLVVAVLVVVALGMTYFVFLVGPDIVGINISSNIYSEKNNIGVLNEICNFTVNLKNNLGEIYYFDITIFWEEGTVYHKSINVQPISIRTELITQRLNHLGEWQIMVEEINHKFKDTYSFLVVTNYAEARIKINQEEQIIYNNQISSCAIYISLIALIISILSLYYTRKKSIISLK